MRSLTLSLIRRNLRSYAAPSRLTYKQQPSCLLASPLLQRNCLFASSSAVAEKFAVAEKVAEKAGEDEKLKWMLKSEIECADETRGFQPNGSPFQIISKRRKQIITFKRDFAGENIVIQVHIPEEDVGADEASGRIVLFANISKGKRPGLEFYCFVSSDEITIDSVVMANVHASSDNYKVVYERREFSELDENLQKEFHKYLEVRGIKSSLINFLQAHRIYKDNKDYLQWLKNVKDFIS